MQKRALAALLLAFACAAGIRLADTEDGTPNRTPDRMQGEETASADAPPGIGEEPDMPPGTEDGTPNRTPDRMQGEETASADAPPGTGEEPDMPPYAGEPYAVIGDNRPDFGEDSGRTDAFESYSELDGLGRCGCAYANVCRELMPTEERGEIGQIRPSGWHTVKYDCIPDRYLYNRCHLIGYQLCGENANERNLITGTRYLNVSGMLPFENQVADYVLDTGNHVLYRVTPVFTGDHLVADGVRMEAWSVEDAGEGVCFDVFVYNVQPGVMIDYATGESREENGL